MQDISSVVPLTVFAVLFLITAIIASMLLIRKIVFFIISVRARKKIKEMAEAAHCKGPHEYIKIYLAQTKRESNVCKECGYCSDLDGYYPVSYIKAIATLRSEQVKYQEWKDKQIKEISLELGLDLEKTEKLTNRILAFRRDYQIKIIEERSGR